MEILELTIQATGYTDVTAQILPRLSKWAADGQITGDALCVVTMVSGGAGLLVTDLDPSTIPFSSVHEVSAHPPFVANVGGIPWAHQIPGHAPLTVDRGPMRDLFARTSEIFAVRGPAIAGGRRIWVWPYRIAVKCEVALSLL